MPTCPGPTIFFSRGAVRRAHKVTKATLKATKELRTMIVEVKGSGLRPMMLSSLASRRST